MAFDYLRSLPPAGQEPAPSGAETNHPPEIVTAASGSRGGDVPWKISTVEVERVEWTDSCFGLGGPAESCLQAITPGWLLTFEVDGQQYEVRTDEAGSAFRLAPQGS
jgi:hypothetical protein